MKRTLLQYAREPSKLWARPLKSVSAVKFRPLWGRRAQNPASLCCMWTICAVVLWFVKPHFKCCDELLELTSQVLYCWMSREMLTYSDKKHCGQNLREIKCLFLFLFSAFWTWENQTNCFLLLRVIMIQDNGLLHSINRLGNNQSPLSLPWLHTGEQFM